MRNEASATHVGAWRYNRAVSTLLSMVSAVICMHCLHNWAAPIHHDNCNSGQGSASPIPLLATVSNLSAKPLTIVPRCFPFLAMVAAATAQQCYFHSAGHRNKTELLD